MLTEQDAQVIDYIDNLVVILTANSSTTPMRADALTGGCCCSDGGDLCVVQHVHARHA
jgi:hypothetical protein